MRKILARRLTKALLVFAAVFAMDFIWAVYTLAMVERSAFMAASYAGLIILLSGAAQIGYTKNHWLLIPAFIGAFAGTFAAIGLSPAP